MILQVNKKYFQNLAKGEHNIKIGFTDGEAESSFKVSDSITFYIHGEERIPFTATKDMTWADWILSFNTQTSSGNGILWVGLDNNSLFIDPRCEDFKNLPYNSFSLGNTSLRFKDMDSYTDQNLEDAIIPNKVYGCSICCFDAGTQILMADNSLKNIEDIVIGDEVLSYNEIEDKFEVDKVTNTLIKENSDDLVYIKLSNGIEIGMRAYHPLLTTEGWKSLRPTLAETIRDLNTEVSQLNVGDFLIGTNENPTIIKIINRDTPVNHNTYNFTVEKNHNYIANGIVAHNASCVI